jgi:hypothetical protein
MPNRDSGTSLAERLTNQVPEALGNAAATFVDSLKINSISDKVRRGRHVLIKRRNVYGEQLAELSNLYFRMSGIPIRFWRMAALGSELFSNAQRRSLSRVHFRHANGLPG